MELQKILKKIQINYIIKIVYFKNPVTLARGAASVLYESTYGASCFITETKGWFYDR